MASQFLSVKKWKYDVFLNFLPEDFNKRFVTDLYKRLEDIGIKAFKHDGRSAKLEPFSAEISEAIEESRIAITIFSEMYALSRLCLEEITKIMECVGSRRQKFFPVFYRTKPSEVSREFNFEHGDALDDLPGANWKRVQRYKDALSKAFDIVGYKEVDSYDYEPFEHIRRNAEECIEEIVDKASQVMNIAKYPVGIRSRVEEVKSLLKIESGGVHSIGIWGMAGVGKTTVARALFNEISCQFEESCFLPNVRRVLEKHGPGGLHHLQQKLLSQILKKHSVSLANFARGGELISQMLRFKKVLIVLDDMDDSFQLEFLVGKHDWFNDGSRVITTSRSFDLLGKHDVLYRVPELTNNEALEFFSWHAFQQGAPVKDFEELSRCVVDYAKGLPLALEVLGSFLYKQSREKQISALYRLQDFRDGKIVRLLIISLDALGAEYKNIFLHIACFFRGKKEKDVITVLNRLGFKLRYEIDVLRRSFLYISEGMIEIHNSIAQMGQQVARDAEQGKPWNCSRLWHGKDMNTVFSANQIARTHTFSVAPQNEANQKWKYDAFLSFRGDDTRNNFVAHLYKRLQDIGINVFKDDVKLERGKIISTELLKAIEESRTAIIIFSEDYASSTWCLEELTMIMECVDKKEQKAYPVFYNVEPSDIRMKTALLKRWKNTWKISRLIL
ncbi:hypothetical protein AABB24_011085 [Solanum stoloniferum]|uniref:TIR domain-containing protein n=1 Tax=Solanum stoloniferum TaxID=62892 RepID=A0ABD2UBP0_9SOLN